MTEQQKSAMFRPMQYVLRLTVSAMFGRLMADSAASEIDDLEHRTTSSVRDSLPSHLAKLIIGYIGMPLVLLLILLAGLSVTAQGLPERLYLSAFFLGFAWVATLTLGEEPGLATAVTFIESAVLLSLANLPPEYFNASFCGVLGFAGASGCAIAALRPSTPQFKKTRPRLQRIAFYIANGVMGFLVISLAFSAMGLLGQSKPTIYTPITAPVVLISAIFSMIPASLAVWFNRRAANSLSYLLRMALMLLVLPLTLSLLTLIYGSDISPFVYGLMGSSLFGSAFTLPYSIGSRSGANSAVTGALSGMSIFVLQVCINIVFTGSSDWWCVVVGAAGIALGLTRIYWQPVVLYPLEMLWNASLYVLELTARPRFQLSCWLSLHSALWDHYQFLPMPLLRPHLTHVLDHYHLESSKVARKFDTGVSRHALRQARIELDLIALTGCENVRDIASAHTYLLAGSYNGQVAGVIRGYASVSREVDAALAQINYHNRIMLFRSAESELDELLRVTGLREMQTQERLTTINNRWHDLIESEIEHLTRQLQNRGEVRNPYVVGVPLTDAQEVFIGRTDVVERIENLLTDIQRPPVLLYGQRRMGKTSLLRNFRRLLPPTIVPIVIDCEGIANSANFGDLLYGIAREIVRAAQHERRLQLQLPLRQVFVETPFIAFNDWLDELERALAANGFQAVLLALDEFVSLLSVEQGRYSSQDFLRLLRHTIQHREHVKVLLAGSQALDELHVWSNYLVNVQVVKLGNLSLQGARQLIEKPTRDFALRYQSGAARRAYAITSGHPALTQLLCYEIVALKNEQPLNRRHVVTVSDVNRAQMRAIESGQFFFADIERNQLNAASRSVLCKLASRGEGAALTRDELAGLLPDENIDSALVTPLRRELLVQDKDRYRFAVEMVRLWFELSNRRLA